jgi:hypothetical protein
MNRSPVNKTGFWSATLSVLFAMGYSVPQILSEIKIIPHPQYLFWLFLPSLFLAPAFLITMICLHYSADKNLQVWTAIGAAFALLYCADVSMVYFTQLTVVVPAQLKGQINEKEVLLFDRKTFLMAVDCLGYFFMSLSTFFAAFAFKKNKWLYRGLLWNGALMPVLVLAFFYPVFYYAGAAWMITFPLAMINAATFFKNEPQTKFKINLEYENKQRMAPGSPDAKEPIVAAKN